MKYQRKKYMRTVLYIIIFTLLMISCSNKKRPAADFIQQDNSLYEVHNESEMIDSTIKESKHQSPGKTVSSSYHNDHDDDESDNMRGFDPPSEDDMDDNGMSRYMENNDEEGWN